MKLDQNHLNKYLAGAILALLLVTFDNVSAQTTIFQDSKGESAFKVFGNALTISTADESINFSTDVFNDSPDGSNSKFRRWGIVSKINANEGLGKLKGTNGFLIDGELGGYYGLKRTADILVNKGEVAWAREKYISITANVDRNKLYEQDLAGKITTFTKGYGGFKIEAGYFGYYKNWLYGISVNTGQKTNIDDLTAQTVLTKQKITNDSVSVYEEESAYQKQQLLHNLWNANINADLAYSLYQTDKSDTFGSLLLAVQFRYQAIQNGKNSYNPAIGIYLAKPGAPQNIVLGLSAQFIDISNEAAADNNYFDRLTINLTAGFKLN